MQRIGIAIQIDLFLITVLLNNGSKVPFTVSPPSAKLSLSFRLKVENSSDLYEGNLSKRVDSNLSVSLKKHKENKHLLVNYSYQ